MLSNHEIRALRNRPQARQKWQQRLGNFPWIDYTRYQRLQTSVQGWRSSGPESSWGQTIDMAHSHIDEARVQLWALRKSRHNILPDCYARELWMCQVRLALAQDRLKAVRLAIS